MQSLVEGKLSPFLVPRSSLKNVIKGISDSLKKNHKGFYLCYTDPAFYYSHAKFLYARHMGNIYISVRFPISTHAQPLQMYKVISLPVPLNATSSHATQLLSVPEYLAITHHHDYFVPLSHADLLKCTQTPVSLCTNNIPLSPITKPDCTLAIFQNSPKLVKNFCNFRFVPNVLKPNLIELSSTSVLVYKVNSLILDCPKEQKIVPGCTFCIMHIPCKCSFSTDELYLPPRLVTCYTSKDENGTTLHPFNLALLQEFFDEKKLFNMLANTTFSTPITFEIPNFQIYNHSMNKVLADDKSYHLSLKKMATAAKKDAVIFKHLAEPLANGLVSIPKAWPDTNAFLIFGTMAATVLAWIVCIILVIKLRKMSIALSVMQQVVHVKSQTLPMLVYQKPSVSTEKPVSLEQLILSEISWVHGVFILCMCIIFILIVFLCILLYKKRSRGTILHLEVTSGCHCVMVPIMSLPLCPSYYKFSNPTITDISVTSFPSCRLTADWQPFTVVDKQSGKSINVPNSVNIGMMANRKLKKILRQPFCVYLYISHDGVSTLLKQSSLLDEILDV